MKFIREWSNRIGLLTLVIGILSTLVLSSRAIVTQEQIKEMLTIQDAKFNSSQELQNQFLIEQMKSSSAWAADRAARKAVREYVEFTRSGKLPPDDND